MKFNVAVCDDEEIYIKQVIKYLGEDDNDYYIDKFSSGNDLLDSDKEYDIIFLDIELGDDNGLDIAKKIRERKRNDYIIFMTSHVDYMPEAFRVRAFRFLSKPIDKDDFYEGLYSIQNEMDNRKRIIISTKVEKVNVPLEDIVYIESLGYGSCVYTLQENFITPRTLKYWVDELPDNMFFNIHKSFIVGFKHVKTVEKDEIIISGDSYTALPLARRKKQLFSKAYFQYMKVHAVCL